MSNMVKCTNGLYLYTRVASLLPMDFIWVVYKFIDVFSIDFPGMPLDYNINFVIDVELGTMPISIPPYKMAPAELMKSVTN